MLHEAVGHGLEGDFNRKKTSAFAGLMGQQVAAKGVTVVDDGTIAERRGSLTVDDEGTPTNRTVLIEDGKLVGYMQDRQNARLMGMAPTGNGRRESYAHQPMPRMTNTYMTAATWTPAEIIASVKKGIYAVSFGGGQVDITSGKFVFGCTEAYMIENGKVTQPIKGAMLIGNGPDAMQRVTMIGNDMKLDTGIGMCGKAGQGVPVGVGQPHLRMNQMTVGGTRVDSDDSSFRLDASTFLLYSHCQLAQIMASSIVILTGAGISAESGVATFRDKDGIWSKVDYRDVATPQGFARDPGTVHDFYNMRRRAMAGVRAECRASRAGAAGTGDSPAICCWSPRTSTTCTSRPARRSSSTCMASCARSLCGACGDRPGMAPGSVGRPRLR